MKLPFIPISNVLNNGKWHSDFFSGIPVKINIGLPLSFQAIQEAMHGPGQVILSNKVNFDAPETKKLSDVEPLGVLAKIEVAQSAGEGLLVVTFQPLQWVNMKSLQITEKYLEVDFESGKPIAPVHLPSGAELNQLKKLSPERISPKADAAKIPVLWESLKKWFEKNLPHDPDWNDGATEAELDAFEKKIGMSLPKDFRAFYSLCNGQFAEPGLGLFFGEPLIMLKESLAAWENEVEFARDAFELDVFEPKGRVRPVSMNTSWIPFTYDMFARHIGIDLDPDKEGYYGQVFNYYGSGGPNVVMANSLTEFLEWLLKELESGNFEISTDPDYPPQYGLKDPPAAYLLHVVHRLKFPL